MKCLKISLAQKFLLHKSDETGATTLSIMTLSIVTFSIIKIKYDTQHNKNKIRHSA